MTKKLKPKPGIITKRGVYQLENGGVFMATLSYGSDSLDPKWVGPRVNPDGQRENCCVYRANGSSTFKRPGERVVKYLHPLAHLVKSTQWGVWIPFPSWTRARRACIAIKGYLADSYAYDGIRPVVKQLQSRKRK